MAGHGRELRLLAGNAACNLDLDARAIALAARDRPQLLRDVAIEHHRRALEAMARACRSAGAVPVLATLSNFLVEGEGAVDLPDEAIAKTLAHLAASESLGLEGWRDAVVRLNENASAASSAAGAALADTSELCDPALFADLCHPTDEGQAVLGRILAQRVAEVIP